MDLDKLVKVLNERQSVNEMPFETGVKQADTEAAAKTLQLSMKVLPLLNK